MRDYSVACQLQFIVHLAEDTPFISEVWEENNSKKILQAFEGFFLVMHTLRSTSFLVVEIDEKLNVAHLEVCRTLLHTSVSSTALHVKVQGK